MDIVELGMDVNSRPLNQTNAEMDRFVREGKRVDGAARGVERSTGLMAAGMKRAAVAIAATVGGLAAIGGGIRTLADFERQMSTVGSVSRATAAEMQAMRDVAAELGSTTEFTAQQAGEGLEFLARAGFSAAESVSAIPAVLDLATASAMGLGAAADISSNIMSAFGIAADNAASVADVLAAASSRANTDVQQLGDAMSFVGPVAAALDIQMSDAAAAIGVLSDAGIQGSTAGTGLRRVLSSLANPTKEAADTLAALGLEMETLNPQTNDLTSIVDQLAGAGLTAADALTIFGDRGGPAILALTSQTGRLEELTAALTGVEGEAARMADTMRDNLGGDIDSLFSSIQGLVIALGDAGLTAVIRGVIQALTGFVRGVSAVVDAVGVGIAAIGDFANAILGIKTAEEIREAAIDNVTIAMGDQMRATAELNRMIREGLPSNVAMIEAKISEAQARRANVQELIAERQELELAALGYFDLIEQIAQTRQALDALRAPGDDLEQMPANMRASFEETEQALVAMLERQKEMLASVRSGNFLREEEQAHLDEIEGNLDALRALMAELTGETASNVQLTGRLSTAAAQIDFSQATTGAKLLADQLGIGLARAIQMDAVRARGVGDNGVIFDPRDPNFDPLIAEMARLREEAEVVTLNTVGLSGALAEISKPSGTGKAAAESIKGLTGQAAGFAETMSGAILSAEEFGQQSARILIGGIDGVANAWGDFVSRGFTDFKDFADSVLSSFQSLIAQMIATAARNRILIGLGFGGAGLASPAGALGGGGLPFSGGGGILGGLFGTGGGGLAGLAGSGGLLGGIGSLASGVSGIFSGGGLGASFANLGGLLSGSVGGLGAIGAAIPAIGAIFAGVSLISGLFKSRKTLIDQGLIVDVQGALADVDQFQTIRKKSLFRSRTRTSRFDAPADVANPIAATIADFSAATLEMAEAIGIGEDALDGFTSQIVISTKGLQGDAAQKAVEDALQGLLDQMAGTALGAGGLSLAKSGEAASDTLARLSSSIVLANEAFGAMRFALRDISLAGAASAAELVDLVGGADQFRNATTFFFENFFSEAERVRFAREELRGAFSDLGLELPGSAREFRDLVEQSIADSANELTAALLQMAPTFDFITDRANDLTRYTGGQSLFRTRADQVFADAAAGSRSTDLSDTDRGLLREVVRAIREGDLNNARLTNRLLAIEERRELEPSA